MKVSKGKYKGKTWEWVMRMDRQYVKKLVSSSRYYNYTPEERVYIKKLLSSNVYPFLQSKLKEAKQLLQQHSSDEVQEIFREKYPELSPSYISTIISQAKSRLRTELEEDISKVIGLHNGRYRRIIEKNKKLIQELDFSDPKYKEKKTLLIKYILKGMMFRERLFGVHNKKINIQINKYETSRKIFDFSNLNNEEKKELILLLQKLYSTELLPEPVTVTITQTTTTENIPEEITEEVEIIEEVNIPVKGEITVHKPGLTLDELKEKLKNFNHDNNNM